jgi:hypothetical protein
MIVTFAEGASVITNNDQALILDCQMDRVLTALDAPIQRFHALREARWFGSASIQKSTGQCLCSRKATPLFSFQTFE